MGEFVVGIGEKVHVVTRRLFPDDVRRHFAGSVVGCAGNVIKVEGFAFVLRAATNEYERRSEKRVRVFSLSDGGNIVNVLPESVVLDKLRYEFSSGRLIMTDGAGYQLDLTEFGAGVRT